MVRSDPYQTMETAVWNFPITELERFDYGDLESMTKTWLTAKRHRAIWNCTEKRQEKRDENLT